MVDFPPFEFHADVWLVAVLWTGAYAMAFIRVAPRLGRPTRPNRLQLISHVSAVTIFLTGSIWPVHDVAEQSLYFVHMFQHLAFLSVMALFIVLSLPTWLARWLLVRKYVLPIVRKATRFIPATILFNVLIVAFHWPALVTWTIDNGLVHFLAHLVMVVCFAVIWMVIISPAPEIGRPTPIVQILFLFLQSVLPTLPASFLTFGKTPLYQVYIDLPQLFNLSALDDQRIAGIVMKLGTGLLLWAVIAVVFFQWSSGENKREIRNSERPSNRMIEN